MVVTRAAKGFGPGAAGTEPGTPFLAPQAPTHVIGNPDGQLPGIRRAVSQLIPDGEPAQVGVALDADAGPPIERTGLVGPATVGLHMLERTVAPALRAGVGVIVGPVRTRCSWVRSL